MTKTLEIGTFLKAEGFDSAFPLNGVRSYCDYDPQGSWDSAVAKGQETAWCINTGYAITNEPMEIKLAKAAKKRADFTSATEVKTGDIFIIEGAAQRCTVNGPRFSDPIVFRPV